mgnify:CR=1 FL=1
MTALFLIINYNLSVILKGKAINDMSLIVSDQTHLVESYISGLCDFIDGYSKAPAVQEALLHRKDPEAGQRLKTLTRNYSSSHSDLEGLYTADWSTHVIEHTNPQSVGLPFQNEVRAKVLEYEIKKAGAAFCSGVVQSPLSKRMVISVYAPVFDENGAAIGFAGAAFFSEGLGKELAYLSESSAEYMLIDADTNQYIYHSNADLVGQKSSDLSLLEAIQSFRNEGGKSLTKNYTDGNSVVTCRFMAQRNWVFAAKDTDKNVFRVAATAKKILLIICIIITATMMLICAVSVEYQMTPIRDINSEIMQLKKADYNHEDKIKVYCKRKDEFGNIANAVEELHLSMENQSQLFQEVLEAQTVGTLITDADDTKILLINKVAMQFFNLVGKKKEDITIAEIQALFDEKELEKIREAKQIAKLSKEEITFETSIVHKNGKRRCLLSHMKCIHLSNGEVVLIFSSVDITSRKKLEENLLLLSETDSLTSLCNRRSGEYKVKRALIEGKFGMFCLFDANKFKFVNDNFGHSAGDKVLIEIAKSMKKTFRDSDILVRLGGDEFVVYATGIESQEVGKLVLERFIKNIEAIEIPELGGHKISISLGAVFISENEDFAQMYAKADSLMYDCKKQGGNAYKFYNM